MLLFDETDDNKTAFLPLNLIELWLLNLSGKLFSFNYYFNTSEWEDIFWNQTLLLAEVKLFIKYCTTALNYHFLLYEGIYWLAAKSWRDTS